MKFKLLVILFFITSWQITAQLPINDSLAIHYNIGKYKLTKINKSIINNYLKELDTTQTYTVKIVSSADYLGTNQSNFILAENRAKKIKFLLIKNHAKYFTSIETVNKGEISEKDKEAKDKIIGNVKNRKTSIIFISNKINSKEKRQKKTKKVYIYNPVKKEFKLEIGKKFILKNLIFYRGTSKIQNRSKHSLTNLLRFLKENPNIEVEIKGHLCCNAGRYQPDKSKIVPLGSTNLSTKRARLVYKYLVRHGIRINRLTYHGYGFQNPLYYPEINDKDKSLNKRVEVEITNF